MLEIAGMGCCHPTNIISNKFLEDLGIESSAEWILAKIGISERRTILPLEYIQATKNKDPQAAFKVAEMTPVDLAEKATQMALEKAHLRAKDIGLILYNSCIPYHTSPSDSYKLATKLGISVATQDVFTACPAFALHIDYLRRFKVGVLPKYVLCISTATLTQKVDYSNRSDSAIWGDGAAAWIVSTNAPGKLKILDSTYATDPLRCNAVAVESFGHFHQDGRAVRDFSVRHTVRMIKAIEEKHNIDWTQDIFVGHQANGTMLDQICNNRGIPANQHWHNVGQVGNQAGAGAPAVIAQNWDRIKPGQRIVVAVLGAGLSWGSMLLQANE